MSKTILTEEQINKITFEETWQVLREINAIPNHSPEDQVRIDILKERSSFVDLMKKFGGSMFGAAKPGIASPGAAKAVSAALSPDVEEPPEEPEEEPEDDEEKGVIGQTVDAVEQMARDTLDKYFPPEKRPFSGERPKYITSTPASLQKFELAVDVIGPFVAAFVPVWGSLLELIIAAKDFAKGDYIAGSLMAAASFPGVGVFFTAAYVAAKTRNKVAFMKALRALNETGLVGRGKGVDFLKTSNRYIGTVQAALTDKEMLEQVFRKIPGKPLLYRFYGIPVGTLDDFTEFMIRETDRVFSMKWANLSYATINLLGRIYEVEAIEGTDLQKVPFDETYDFANEIIGIMVKKGASMSSEAINDLVHKAGILYGRKYASK